MSPSRCHVGLKFDGKDEVTLLGDWEVVVVVDWGLYCTMIFVCEEA
eukprot:CAMPEP_0116543708 /NCGR_PEP_ID=MMETSP0397-20121206/1714_1 /TAXON_ID=216820 /ORGANISM="Cyclophora tenuis, Strain ECT3854" /LENGTH=45 /DNA_ID= /DNA_START= /DNA_END= /DNA_ORIENTATION=